MQHELNRFLRLYHMVLTALLACIVLALPLQSASAQTQAKPDVQVQAETPPVLTEEKVDVPPVITLPVITKETQAYSDALEARRMADKAVRGALDSGDSTAFGEAVAARTLADKALADAAILKDTANIKGAELGSNVADKPKKKSFIPTNVDEVKAILAGVWAKIFGWLTSPSFLAQVGMILGFFFLAPLVARFLNRKIPLFHSAPAEGAKLRIVRDYIYQSRNFLRAIVLVALLAGGAALLKAIPMLGQDWLVKIAQGLAVVFLLFKAIKQFVPNPLFQKITLWVALPLALLMVFGYYDNLIDTLNGTTIMSMGDTPITAMTLVRLGIFGALFFRLGSISNSKGQSAIRSQETLDVATREVVAKIFQMLLFVILFVLILSFAGIPLSGLVVIFSAIGLGMGFGLQPIAANFVSGLIILFDRSVKVGDFVLLPDGQEGHVEAINMRSTIVETTDGKDIMVPNVKFIEEAYENWTHTDPRQRYEVYFSVAYNTNLDTLEDILITAVSEHPKVLQEPEKPDLELREFGDSGIKFAIEFWADGIDDGENKFTSDLNFIVWRTLKKHKIEMPLPQREVRMLK